MDSRIVDLQGQPRADVPVAPPDIWFAHVDIRLGRIEFMVSRLEWQIWLIVCGWAGLLVQEIVNALAGRTQ